jgi:fructan beta-fructosidase
MTLPRDLSLQKMNGKYYVISTPSKEIDRLQREIKSITKENVKSINVTNESGLPASPSLLSFRLDKMNDFALTLSNDAGEQTVIGFDKNANQFFIDRRKSGKTDFEQGFASRSAATRIASGDSTSITLIIDDASVELFADDGLTVMTAIFFPSKVYSTITLEGQGDLIVKELRHASLEPIQ